MLDTVWRASEDVEVKLHACKCFRFILYVLMNTGIPITPTVNQNLPSSLYPVTVLSLALGLL